MGSHSLLKVGDVKSQIFEAIASINGTLQNFGTNSFIIFACSQLPLDLIFSICEGKNTLSVDPIVTLVELEIQFTKC
jgi:hypothetical protein